MSKKSQNPYRIFPKYVLRTPLFSFSYFKKLTSGEKIDDIDFRKLFEIPEIEEALFLASPSFYTEIQRWLNHEIDDKKKVDKIKYSILKYISRMSSRCTPFGLFAGCSVGNFDEKTALELKEATQHKRHTRLDMNYLVALSQDLINNQIIREQLLFYPNTSIYKAGNQLRYIEYKYVNSQRHHHIVGVDDTEYIDMVLTKATKGILLADLVEALIDDEITKEEASEFINELVSSQILISELEPSVSGPEFLEQIKSVLKKINGVKNIIHILEQIDKKLATIDTTIGNNPQEYINFSEFLKELKTDFELKFLFQTDMVLSNTKNTLNKEIINDIQRGFTFLNKISLPPRETLLSKFKDSFYERYEEREVPLSIALDVEMGLGYKQDQGSGDVSPIVDDILLPRKENKYPVREIKWTEIDTIFQKKLLECYKEDAYTITLDDNDFKEYEAHWDDLPDTLSCMIEMIMVDGKEKIYFNGGGGSSAGNLLGRFCHGDKELYKYTKEIIDLERTINKDKILAEIVHLPESRVGNILMRPDFRKFEIPYLAKSIKTKEFQLPLDDLMISARGQQKIRLRSKSNNKEVIPHLTNAHNYSSNSLPIYHFLADLQTQNIRNGVGFNLGPFSEEYVFLPRVEYQNLILQKATWNLKKNHIEKLEKSKNDDKLLLEELKIFQEKLHIPDYVMLTDGDNELLINFKNLTSVRMLLDTVSKRSRFKITEFLFSEKGVVKQGEEYFTNQVIVSFYNEGKLKKGHGE